MADKPLELPVDIDIGKFTHWMQKYIDGLDSVLFTGDEFVGIDPATTRKHNTLRQYLARWTKRLDELERENKDMRND
jgi:hypothetical protein